MHHLLLNKFALPYSGPLTSDPAIGWLKIQFKDLSSLFFFNFKTFFLVDPTSVIIALFVKTY